MAQDNNSLPRDAEGLASWFAEGVRSELSALEKDGNTQSYELLSGKLIQVVSATKAIYHFIIADGSRIPEDSTGKLKTTSVEYLATVTGQQMNRIDVCIEGTPLPPGIHRAMLVIDDTALLRRLAEVLEFQAANPSTIGPLATTVFHPQNASVGSATLPNSTFLVKLEVEKKSVIEQACGSSVTFIWGPPGTGKTYTIAYLVTALIEAGERVLVTSHTHAAVDQSLYEAVKSETDKAGPLSDHPIVTDGKVLRIGLTSKTKTTIPDSVRLDKVVDSKARTLTSEIARLEVKAKPLADKRGMCQAQISEWYKLSEFITRLNSSREIIKQLETKLLQSESAISAYKELLNKRHSELERAQRAWFLRMKKIERATIALQHTKSQLQNAETNHSLLQNEVSKFARHANDIQASLVSQKVVCEKLLARPIIERELSTLALELNPLEEKIRFLQDEVSQLEQKTISEARAIFCTLTKLYTGKELDGQAFDAVIVDEISMAIPPLIFLAAGRATSRIVLVGDFPQLSPIVRSDTEVSNARLGRDIFCQAGIARDLKPAENCTVLTKLRVQRRMVPNIADVARYLVYTQAGGLDDHPEVTNRDALQWLDFLPLNPLLIVDSADLHCWSGKQPGSLSRFNFYSATVAVEVAALAAAKLPKPPENDPPPIGIVTPFAAQRRLLSKLLEDMELGQWVAVGTVHTFQGGQADLIIFDSVLDEPYWAARLCTPRDTKDVRRELNVAVTRAKNKFVLIGSSEWLNKYARPASGLGQLWGYLKEHADLISAIQLVQFDTFQRVFDRFIHETGWNVPDDEKGHAFEHLDEESFFFRFATDINAATDSIFALAPYFGEYRWPRIEPLFAAALHRGVKMTIVTPPLIEVHNIGYVEKVIEHLRSLGAIVVTASGVHGKDVIIDERIVYTGSMNWSSNRGRSEEIHRLLAPEYAKICLNLMQAKHIRQAAVHEDGASRSCQICGHATQVVNQRQQHSLWDHQSMKVGCTNPECPGYLRDIDERPPFRNPPLCQVDGRTRYRIVKRGRGKIWQCPKHPRECKIEKVVPGDPE